MKLCCFFNYPPLYRQSIYKRIDDTFDCQFYFGREVEGTTNSGIKKLDFSIFKRCPKEFDNLMVFGRYLWRRKLLRLAFSSNDTFIVTGDFCWTYLPFLFLCKLIGKRVYAWGHGEKSNKRKAWKFEKYIYRWLTGYFTYGNGGRKRLMEFGIPGEKIHVIYNSLVDHIDGASNIALKSDILKKHFGNGNPTIVFIGRLTPQKKLGRLLDMMYAHRCQGLQYNMLIIGDGCEMESLKKKAAKYELTDTIWFFGECYEGTELNTLLYNSDLCVSPGNVGLTALHTMQYGVPVISHDDFETQMPEYEAIIPGKTGALFKKDDMHSMIEVVAGWLSNHSSLENRNVTREECYAVINEYFNSTYQIELLKKVLKK
ncbi:glycosyltransferase [uncultured Muribaculum sp.]|uniref:glycosyltransferase n=1 Tax=uncultured Muribaculum sp. TaxID=1918613 RepID=UPI0025EA05B7|nr:glycosyltransferase [uncultured Muribaculum sp.]